MGFYISAFLEFARKLPEETTFIVAPEGVMLNYLARRNNSSRYYSFIPFEVELYGEETIIADFNKNPPDYFIIQLSNIR